MKKVFTITALAAALFSYNVIAANETVKRANTVRVADSAEVAEVANQTFVPNQVQVREFTDQTRVSNPVEVAQPTERTLDVDQIKVVETTNPDGVVETVAFVEIPVVQEINLEETQNLEEIGHSEGVRALNPDDALDKVKTQAVEAGASYYHITGFGSPGDSSVWYANADFYR